MSAAPKFTPGPWVAWSSCGAVRTTDDRAIASVYGHNGKPDIDAPGVAENLALIAAAPDLYEALRVARSQLETLGGRARKSPGNDYDEIHAEVLGAVDAALARAEVRP